MGIVIITNPGEDKRTFANSLFKKTLGGVDLVIIQRPKLNHNSFLERLKRLYRSVGLWRLPKEIFYAVRLRANTLAKDALGYFRERSPQISESEFLPKILETNSVHDENVLSILKNLSPKLLVIWGSVIVRPEILSTAERAINLHMGFCPHYRGAVANQRAVMLSDFERIGATIHYADRRVDTGEIIERIVADINKPPRELFRDLNDRAEERFLEVATRLFAGETLPSTSQKAQSGDKFLLRDWTPSVRYKTARQILEWERAGA